MRRSINEKLHILKQSKSKKKIKKLALQYGITTKTINNWQKALEEGRLKPVKAPDNGETVSSSAAGSKRKILREFVFKSEKTEPQVYNGCGSIYRYLFSDTNTGFVFCAYSARKDRISVENAARAFLERLTAGGRRAASISADSDPDLTGLKKLLGSYGTAFSVRKLNEIKKHLRFPLKKYSYIYERAKYESLKDFLFDSLATVSRHNDALFQKGGYRSRELLGLINEINIAFHSGLISDGEEGFGTGYIHSEAERIFNKAFEFHKVYDLENADPHYEKIFYSLKDTGVGPDMLVKVIIQRAKICSLKKDYEGAFRLINQALAIIKKGGPVKALELENSAYFLAADISRVRKDKNRALHYVRKAVPVLEKLKDPRTSALSYINIGHVYKNFEEHKKTAYYLNRSKEVIYSSELKDLYPQIEESFASLYASTGKYTEAKKVFEKMIEENYYSDSPFFRSLLFGKTADIYHLTGDLEKSIALYDSALEVSLKHESLRAFTEIILVLRGNRAFTLTKMNRYEEAKNEFLKNLKIAREGNFLDQVLTNTAYLALCSIGLKDTAGAREYNNQLGELLKNTKRPDHEYKYHVSKGDIERLSGRYEKAVVFFEKALEAADNSASETSYYDTAFKLINLRITMGDYSPSEELAASVRKKAVRKKYANYVFKADVMLKKISCLRSGAEESYIKFLERRLSEDNIKDEHKYFVRQEIEFFHNGHKCESINRNS
jgi:pentatricopeptide repeat protein